MFYLHSYCCSTSTLNVLTPFLQVFYIDVKVEVTEVERLVLESPVVLTKRSCCCGGCCCRGRCCCDHLRSLSRLNVYFGGGDETGIVRRGLELLGLHPTEGTTTTRQPPPPQQQQEQGRHHHHHNNIKTAATTTTTTRHPFPPKGAGVTRPAPRGKGKGGKKGERTTKKKVGFGESATCPPLAQ